MSNLQRGPINTKSISPDLTPLQNTIREVVRYLKGGQLHGQSSTGLLNWLRIKPGGGADGSSFEEDELIFDDEFKIDREVFTEKLQDMIDADGKIGRAPDLMVLSVANDLVAQFEMAANFRRMKPAHHFAKAWYNMRNLAEGALEPNNSPSILEEYTTVFLENAKKHIAE